MKRTKAIIAAALLCSSILFTGCGLTEIDPFDEQYITYEVSGISGYTGRLDVNARNAPSGLTTYYHWDYDEPLSNGDIVKITVTPAEKILKQNGYKVSRMETEYTVSGLEELPETLPEDAANSIMDALQEATFSENAEYVYSVGDEDQGWRTAKILSVGEPQLVKGLYEVTTDRNAKDSPFSNEDEEDTDFLIHPPRASFKALWSITYEEEYAEGFRSPDTGEDLSGAVFTKTDWFYASIDGFSIKDGKVHYNESLKPYCWFYWDMEDKDYTEYVDGFKL